jgi:hypothetical protein
MGVAHGVTGEMVQKSAHQLGQDSELNWSNAGFTGLSFDFNDIELSGFTQPDAILELDLLSWIAEPFLYPAICKLVRLDPPSSGSYSGITVEVFGVSSDAVVIGTDWGELPLPNTGSRHYAGSWGEDKWQTKPPNDGDVGTDSIPESGRSEHLFELGVQAQGYAAVGPTTYPLLFARAGMKLRITFHDAAGTIRMPYPTFVAADGPPTIVRENANQTILYWPEDGPAVRTGTFAYTGQPNVSFGPFQNEGSLAFDLLNCLAFRNMVFQARSPLEGVDNTEGIEDEIWRDFYKRHDGTEATLSGIWQGTKCWLFTANGKLQFESVSGGLEQGRFLWYPWQDRDGEFKPTGPRGIFAHSYFSEPWRSVSAGGQVLHMHDPDTDAQITVLESQGQYYSVTRMNEPWTNDELPNYPMKASGVEFAKVSPWWSYFSVLSLGGRAREPANVHDPWGRFARVDAQAGVGLVYHRSRFGVPVNADGQYPGWDFEVVVDADHEDELQKPCLAVDHRRDTILLDYTKLNGSTLQAYRCHSDDGGRTWSDIIPGMGVIGRTAVNQYGDVCRAGFVPDSGDSGPGTIKTTYQAAGQQAEGPERTARDDQGNAIRVEDDGFDLSYSPDFGGRLLLSATPESEDDTVEWQSFDDGETFVKVQ